MFYTVNPRPRLNEADQSPASLSRSIGGHQRWSSQLPQHLGQLKWVAWSIMEYNSDLTVGLLQDTSVKWWCCRLQELKSSAVSLLIDAVFDDPWTNALTECLAARDYVRVCM